MAKDKERSINPAQQQRKLDKAKALKKGKAEVQARRNEKLARRNPDRIQKQVDDLKALAASGEIKPREKQILADLERDLRAVKKAREALGEKAPQYGNRQSGPRVKREGDENSGNTFGKRTREGERKLSHQNTFDRDESSGEETDESVRRIPMPRDTPPPILHSFRRTNHNRPANANLEPLSMPQSHPLPPRPVPESRTTYSSAPQIRDLKREAVNRFVPSVVRQKQEAAKGVGGKLVEPEEMDRLEAEGYVASGQRKKTESEDMIDEGDEDARRLADEEARFQCELEMNDVDDERGSEQETLEEQKGAIRTHRVEIEDVEDEDM